MKISSILTICSLGMLPFQAAAAEPNVLLIIADDVGLDAVPCYDVHAQQAPMPNLQQLCDNGLVFENAYAAPVCSPTRATIMTGKYGFRTGVGSAIPRDGGNGLSADETSLFDVLSDTDYSANLIGKWHLAGAGTDMNHPAELGVPDYFGLISGGTRNYYSWTAVENGQQTQIDGYATTVFTDRAIDWIGQQDSPWFLWLAYNAPHSPFHLPPADLHSFDDLVDDADAAASNPLPYYQAMLEALDTEIGRLLASVDQATRDNTIVMFVGDNGSPNQVTRGLYGDHRAKGTIFDSGTNVPFVVSGPDVQPGRTDALVQSADLFATVASIAGAELPPSDSISFDGVLSGDQGAREFVYVEHFADEIPSRNSMFGWAVRHEDYKLISAQQGGQMLFDLAADPFEANNLLDDGADYTAIVNRLNTYATSIGALEFHQ